MYAYASADSSGLPHSSHSVTVSGSDGSRMVLSTSTNGTSATMPANASGAWLATAPMSRPPADPPRATSRSGEVHPTENRCAAQATKSVNVFFFAISLPSLVPAAAHLAAAAHVRHGEDEATVQKGQSGDREPWVHARLVRAVSIQDGRGWCRRAACRPGRPGRSAPACRRGPWPTRGAARSRPGRSHRAPACCLRSTICRVCQVVVVDAVRGDQRGVVQPERAGVVLGVAVEADACRSARGTRCRTARPRRGQDPQGGEPVAAQRHHERGRRTRRRRAAVCPGVCGMSSCHAPGSRGRRPGQREVLGAVVVQDQEPVLPAGSCSTSYSTPCRRAAISRGAALGSRAGIDVRPRWSPCCARR